MAIISTMLYGFKLFLLFSDQKQSQGPEEETELYYVAIVFSSLHKSGKQPTQGGAEKLQPKPDGSSPQSYSYSNIFFVPDSVREEKKEVSSVNGYSEYNNVIGLERFLRNLIAK